MKNGVPYDVAFTLSPLDVAAYAIIFGELENNEFDFNRMAWKEK